MAKMAKVSQSSFLMIIFCLVTVAGMGAMLDTCFKGHAFAHSGALHPALDWLLLLKRFDNVHSVSMQSIA